MGVEPYCLIELSVMIEVKLNSVSAAANPLGLLRTWNEAGVTEELNF